MARRPTTVRKRFGFRRAIADVLRAVAMLAVLSAALLLPALGRAEPSPRAEARQHFERGIQLADAKSYKQAAREFHRAYELSPHHTVLYNLGQAYVALDRPVEAVDTLERYLHEGGAQIAASRRSEVEKTIEQQRARFGQVTLVVQPAAASVTLDGQPLARPWNDGPLRLLAGTYRFAATRAGYQPLEGAVRVEGGRSIQVNLTMDVEPRPAPLVLGKLSIDCRVPGVVVEVDGSRVGNSPFAKPIDVSGGEHVLRFVRAGYHAKDQHVSIAPRGTAAIDCDVRALVPVPPDLAATVVVVPNEPNAQILTDGAAHPSDGRVAAGPHRIEVRHPSFRPWDASIRVRPGQTLQIHAELTPTPSFVADHRSRADTQRTVSYVLGGVAIAAAGVAIGLAAWNDGRFDDWEAEQVGIDEAFPHDPHDTFLDQRQRDNDELLESVHDVDTAAVALGVGGGALLTAAVVVFFTGEDPSRYDGVAVQPVTGGGLLTWRAPW